MLLTVLIVPVLLVLMLFGLPMLEDHLFPRLPPEDEPNGEPGAR
ncbi:hypothetical protein ABT133_09435 [Streptomyces sp. NPDC001835]